ncbi:hypothetical protein [Bordetella hinzii]|uniref:hypothetical protein n=1 Tax=Bordetella hinzii TaxID=103855 RepID=UPI000F6C13C3|nr:hypothetical protein [Bordetella hinzii]VEH25240.1 Uncharacterised protein [Bordetella hinzii]
MKPRHQPEQVEYGPMHPDLFDGETPIVWVSGAAEQPATEPRKVRGGGQHDARKRERREETLK